MVRSNNRFYTTSRYRHGWRWWLLFVPMSLLALFLGVAMTNHFLLSSYKVSSTGMAPAISTGFHVGATPLIYGVSIPLFQKRLPPIATPERGDIVVVEIRKDTRPVAIRILDEILRFFALGRSVTNTANIEGLGHPRALKRVVALPGETVRMSRFRAEVLPVSGERFIPEGELLPDVGFVYPLLSPEWTEREPFTGYLGEYTLGKSEYFLLGDTRGVGLDSYLLGGIESNRIIQKVLFAYWPWPPRIF